MRDASTKSGRAKPGKGKNYARNVERRDALKASGRCIICAEVLPYADIEGREADGKRRHVKCAKHRQELKADKEWRREQGYCTHCKSEGDQYTELSDRERGAGYTKCGTCRWRDQNNNAMADRAAKKSALDEEQGGDFCSTCAASHGSEVEHTISRKAFDAAVAEASKAAFLSDEDLVALAAWRDSLANLNLRCGPCNRSKGSRLLSQAEQRRQAAVRFPERADAIAKLPPTKGDEMLADFKRCPVSFVLRLLGRDGAATKLAEQRRRDAAAEYEKEFPLMVGKDGQPLASHSQADQHLKALRLAPPLADEPLLADLDEPQAEGDGWDLC